MLFSLRRKAPKDSPRRCLGLSSICWEAHTHGSKGVAVLAGLAQATSINWEAIYTLLKRSAKINRITMQCYRIAGQRRAGNQCPLENPRPQAQGCRIALAARSACSAVDCVPLRYANTCREPTRRALGSHKRSSGTLAASFRSFLVRTRKGHVSPFQRRRICTFLRREKRYQKSKV